MIVQISSAVANGVRYRERERELGRTNKKETILRRVTKHWQNLPEMDEISTL
jgi:hypothetical protein